MAVADHVLSVLVTRVLVGWNGVERLQRGVRIEHPIAPGMTNVNMAKHGIPEVVAIAEVRRATDPDLDYEVTLAPERGDGIRTTAAKSCGWRSIDEEDTTK